MSIHAEKTLVDVFQPRFEVFRKRHPQFRWEDGLVIELLLHPRHEIVHVLWCGALDRLFDGHAISLPRPQGVLTWC